MDLAACYHNVSCDCDSTFVHAYHSVCVRAQLAEARPDVAKNRAKLGIERASQMVYLSGEYFFTEFCEAELLDLSLEDDG